MCDKESKYLPLLKNTVQNIENNLQEKFQKSGKEKVKGTEFEEIVQDALIKSGFHKEQITHSSQKFPDFVITDIEYGYKIGVEVKKTDSNKWEVIGGSVFESLKNDVEDTYIIMGKFGGDRPEVRLKRYKDCLQDLRVTHSPRFYLDLDIPDGEDYLTRNRAEELLNLSGDELNKKIRQLLRTNKSTWWSEGETISYAELSLEEKNMYLCDGMALFPEVFGCDYSNFTPWLVYSCLVWCGNVRDIFSAGGIEFYQDMYLSAIMYRAVSNIDKIVNRIESMSNEEVLKYWKCDVQTREERIEKWTELVKENIKISNELIGKNKSLERFVGMNNEKVLEKIIEEFVDMLKENI